MENNMESRNLFLFLSNDEGDNYFCRSFFPEEKMDYSKISAKEGCYCGIIDIISFRGMVYGY
jgi:hypothetical protein